MTLTDTGLWDIDEAAYHADHSHVSTHMLGDFERSVPFYGGRYVTHTIPPPEQTAAMLAGSAFDSRLLQPDLWADRYAAAPEEIDRRTNRGKAEWANLEAGGRQVLDHEDWLRQEAMIEAVLAHPQARGLVEGPGRVQQGLRWTCPHTGLPRKALVDKLAETPFGLLIVDVKTAANVQPDEWARAVVRYRYHRQQAAYLEAAREALGEAEADFIFLVVGKESPHEVVLYTVHEEGLDLARRQTRALLEELADRQARGDWSSRWAGLHVTKLPPWAFHQ